MSKQVFILCTGRSGSVSFIRACRHITNYTAAHESKAHALGAERLNYPPNHIEADNRLSWFLGSLEKKYGDHAYYVHLLRNRKATIDSFLNRWGQKGGIIYAFERGILMRKPGKLSEKEKKQVCADYYDTVNNNIEFFLKDKSKILTIHLEHIESDFMKFWEFIGAEGNSEAARGEFSQPSNTSASRKTLSYKFRTFIYRLKTRFK